MSEMSLKQPIHCLAHAESVIALLGRLNTDGFPAEERMAVATSQVQAIDDWLAAYMELSARAPRAIRPSRH
jgi:hypothetical protein